MRFFKQTDNETKNEPTEKSKHSERKGFSSFIAKIICLISAIIVWFYVSGEQSITYEKEFQGVEIKYNTGTLGEKGYSILGGKNPTVNVTVSGTRRTVNSLTNEDITAVADLSTIDAAGMYPIKIDVSVPDNTVVKEVYPYELKLYIDTYTQKSFNVDVVPHNVAMSDASLKIKKYNLSQNEIWVSGPEEEVNKIAKARIDLDFSNEKISNSMTMLGVPITLVDNEGNLYNNSYVTIDKTEANVDVIVNKYVTVPIKAKYSENFSAKSAGYSEVIEPSSIAINGAPEIIGAITYVETAVIDADDISGEKYEKQISLSLPAGVEADGNTSKSVLVNLERTNGKVEVTTENIVLINKSDKFDFKVEEENVTVVFSGNLEDIEKLGGNDVYMVADVKDITGEGSYANIKLRPNLFGKDVLSNGRVRVEGVYTCTVSVKKNDSETDISKS